MELKVWVEGIQRIVCGVTETTTCQDVVYALAHATGKTGRFTLIERWRSNERLLPPQEHPLQVLSKWGEYANDVQLVLRHARESSATSSCRATPDFVEGGGGGGGGVRSPQPHPSDASQLKTTSPQPPPIRKSLTFSSGGSGGVSGREINNHTNCRSNADFPCHNATSAEHAFRDLSKERRDWSDVPRGVVKGIPQQPPPTTIEQQSDVTRRTITSRRSEPSLSDASSYRSREQEAKMISGQNGRISASANSSHAFAGSGQFVSRSGGGSASEGVTSSKHNGRMEPVENHLPNVESASQEKSSGAHHQCASSPRYIPPPPPPMANHVNQCNSSSGGGGSHQSPSNHQYHQPPNCNRSAGSNLKSNGSNSSGSGNSSRSPAPGNPVPVHLGTPKSRRNLLSEFKRHDLEEELQEDFPLDPVGKQERVIFDARYRDLVRLINLQREKLSRQQADLTQYDAEIAYWEEKQKEHQRQIDILECEIKKFEFTGRDVDEEVVQLDRLHLDDELEIGRQQEKILSSELTLLRSKLSNCETELLQCKNKIRLVMDNITEDERWLSKEEDERKQREVTILSEIEMLQNDIQNAIRDYESKVGFQAETSDKYDQDVKRLETVIADKKKQVESLVREMKQANLESLTFTSSDEIRQLLEGGAHKGPGSSRKIVGSPRQLENAVPTSKNPHGVWV